MKPNVELNHAPTHGILRTFCLWWLAVFGLALVAIGASSL